ncbi:MAG: hypothetical protein VYA17_07480 [Pseudomonadota bacterium]|nr:hypothetical protein [Pseudomonadota bacterium]
MQFEKIGKPLRRREDTRLLKGRGLFCDDWAIEGQTHMIVVRSTHAHALLNAIDVSDAKAMLGVLGIFTGVDCIADCLSPIPHNPMPSTKYDQKLHGPSESEPFIGNHILLPADKARYVGEALAVVVAETRGQAEDAALWHGFSKMLRKCVRNLPHPSVCTVPYRPFDIRALPHSDGCI